MKTIEEIKVSVIIPCYNVEDCIHTAVDSVLNQTHPNIELICIDNNSSDSTWNILQEITEKNDNVLITQQMIKGPCPTRNKGIEMASGKWIQFLDADDFIESEKIGYQLEVAGKAGLLDEEAIVVGQKIWKRVDGSVVRNILTEDKWRDLIQGRLGDTCANLWSESIVRKVGGWNENLPSSTEVDLQFRMLKAGAKVVYDERVLTIIIERSSGSITKADPVENYVRVIRQRLDIRSYIAQHEDLKKHMDFLHHFVYNNLKLIYSK